MIANFDQINRQNLFGNLRINDRIVVCYYHLYCPTIKYRVATIVEVIDEWYFTIQHENEDYVRILYNQIVCRLD